MIKQFIKEENEKEPQLQQSINDQNSSIEVAREKIEKKAANVAKFISQLDSEIKRVFICLLIKKKNYIRI